MNWGKIIRENRSSYCYGSPTTLLEQNKGFNKMEKKENNRVFIYGSIKKGFYNHKAFGFDVNTKYLGNAMLKGAKLYSLKFYPAMVLTDDEKDVVHGELYEYNDELCKQCIASMERGAGYVEKEVVINGVKYKTFVFDRKPVDSILIEPGIWLG